MQRKEMSGVEVAECSPSVCQSVSRAEVSRSARMAAVACVEYWRWNRAFIDANGKLANLPAYEAENNGLKDGGAPWRRVAFYWQSSGLLPAMAFKSGATDCNYAAMSLSYPGLGCRGFIIDNPWSAAFISWVMQRAGVPGFQDSPSHFDCVRAARKNANSPYRYLSPSGSSVQPGCSGMRGRPASPSSPAVPGRPGGASSASPAVREDRRAKPATDSAAAIASSAMRRYVVHFPPITLTSR